MRTLVIDHPLVAHSRADVRVREAAAAKAERRPLPNPNDWTLVPANSRRRFKRLQEESKNFESLPIRTRLTEEEAARAGAAGRGFDVQAASNRETRAAW